MKLKIFIFYMFFFLNVKGQTNSIKIENISTKVGLTSEEFTYACNEYKKMMETDSYLQHEKKVMFFASKMEDVFKDKNFPLDSIKNDSLYFKWIIKNFKKTKFKSINEAKSAIEDQIKSDEKMIKEHPRLFELIDKANLEQRHQIFQPFFKSKRKEMLGY